MGSFPVLNEESECGLGSSGLGVLAACHAFYLTLWSPLCTDILCRVAAVVECQRLRARHTRANLGLSGVLHGATDSGQRQGPFLLSCKVCIRMWTDIISSRVLTRVQEDQNGIRATDRAGEC